MTNTMTCAMKREAWTWYLPSHLVSAKILCSRCEPCTNDKYYKTYTCSNYLTRMQCISFQNFNNN